MISIMPIKSFIGVGGVEMWLMRMVLNLQQT